MSPTHTAGTVDLADARSPYEGSCRAHGNDGRAIRDILARIGDKWSLLVIATLHEGRLRFGELLGHIPGISQRMLTQTLRNLQAGGMIEREVFPTMPPSVEYRLSPMGQSFLKPLSALVEWAMANQPAIREARETFAKAA